MKLHARIDARTVLPQRWRNGGGWTRELLTWPDPLHWQLRISLATIESAGPFSNLIGVQRRFTVIDGAGVVLRIDGETHRLTIDSDPISFDGGALTHCAPLEGATSDLNLMTKGGSGELLRTQPGVAWTASLFQRGLFARLAGVFTTDAGMREAVPAYSLLWFHDAVGVTFTFAPDRPEPSTPAWWLGYAR
jgi:environmental stress-induced protein Ves